MRFSTWRLLSSCLPAAALFLAGCAGEGNGQAVVDPGDSDCADGPAGATIDFETQIQPIFNDHCSCHLSLSSPQGVVLLAGFSYDSLVGNPSTQKPSLLLVEPGEPDESYLVIKLDDEVPDVSSLRVGSRMPSSLPPLSDPDIDKIRQWIEEGAEPAAGMGDTEPPVFGGAAGATAASPTEIDVSWSGATDNCSASEDIIYKVFVATQPGAQDFLQPSAVAPSGSSNLRLSGLDPDTQYHIVVRAEDESGNQDDNEIEVSATTLPSDTPPENRPPVADAGGPYRAVIGQPLTVSGDGSSDPDGDSLSFTWTFGDGTTLSGSNPEHTYLVEGVFTLTLVVSDGQLLSEPDTTTVTVAGEDRFPRDPTMDRVCSQCHGLRIRFDDGERAEVTPPGEGLAFFPSGFFIVSGTRSELDWTETVSRMRNDYGCSMSDEEQEGITLFLVENYSDE